MHEYDKPTGEMSVLRLMAVMFLYGGFIFAAAVGFLMYYGADRGNIADIEPAAGDVIPEYTPDSEAPLTNP